jgi:hypothetical protein
MTTHRSAHGLTTPTDAQQLLLEGVTECGYRIAQRAYRGTPQTLMPHAAAQPSHHKIVIFSHKDCHHVLAQRSCCA